MFAKGSKSSGGSRGFSLDCAGKLLPKSRLVVVVDGLQIFLWRARLDPPLPPLLLLPARTVTGAMTDRRRFPPAPQAARRRTGDLSRRQCADRERRLSRRAPARARGALPAADLGGGRQGGRRPAQRARRPGPLRRRRGGSSRRRRRAHAGRGARLRRRDRAAPPISLAGSASPSPRPERCASGSRRQARQDWLWIRTGAASGWSRSSAGLTLALSSSTSSSSAGARSRRCGRSR